MPTPLAHMTANGPVPQRQPVNDASEPFVVKLTVEGQVVSGQARFERDAPNINGTVDEDGALGATIGFQPLRGQFIQDQFEGTFKSFDCEWKALLKRTR